MEPPLPGVVPPAGQPRPGARRIIRQATLAAEEEEQLMGAVSLDNKQELRPLEPVVAGASATANGAVASVPGGRSARERWGVVNQKVAAGVRNRHPAMVKSRHQIETDPSVVSAIEGDEDTFATHELLVQNVRRTAESLVTTQQVHSWGTGMWMTGGFFSLSAIGLLLMKESNYRKPLESVDPHYTDDMFNVNDPVAAFLGITALVYALIFASAYTEAQGRFDEIRRSLVQEANGVHTAMLLVRTLDAHNVVHKMRTLLLCGHYIQMLAEDLSRKQSGSSQRSNIDTLYAIMPSLAKIADDGDHDALDRQVITRVIDMLNAVSEARSTRETAVNNKQHWITYAFLLEMGGSTVFGVLILQVDPLSTGSVTWPADLTGC
jgi:hypothetical protein